MLGIECHDDIPDALEDLDPERSMYLFLEVLETACDKLSETEQGRQAMFRYLRGIGFEPADAGE